MTVRSYVPKKGSSRKHERTVQRIVRMAEKTQSQKFIDKARELGCDEDEKAFDDKLKRIAKAKPKGDDRAGKQTK